MNKSILEVGMDDRYIGVFDSGLGGITVLQELNKALPGEKFVFLADTNRSPYGEKSKEELYKIVYSNIETLIKIGVKAIVFACNTASSLDLSLIRSKYKLPIITVLEATVEEVLPSDKKILIAATQATIKSSKHKELISDLYPSLDVVGQACPLIVPSIEFEDLSSEEAQNIVVGYMGGYRGEGFDALVLGCTHYPIWQGHFISALPGVRIINPAEKTAEITKEVLEKHKMLGLNENSHTNENVYLVTSDADIFKGKLRKIFGINPKIVKKIQII